MVTRLYLNKNAAPSSPKPTSRQHGHTISQYVSGNEGGGLDTSDAFYPLVMSTTNGADYAGGGFFWTDLSEPGEAHYGWNKMFISAPLRAQTIPNTGTITAVLDYMEGNVLQNCLPHLLVYVWKGDNSGVRGILYDSESGTEADLYLNSPQTFFNAVTITNTVVCEAGDVLVFEMHWLDNNTTHQGYTHGYRHALIGYDCYIEFSMDIAGLLKMPKPSEKGDDSVPFETPKAGARF